MCESYRRKSSIKTLFNDGRRTVPCSLWRIGTVRCFKKISYNLFSAGSHIMRIFLLSISNKTKLRSDSAIALLSTGSLAVGVMILSVTTGMNTDVCNYLFGSILGMRVSDMYITIVVCSVIMVIYACLYRKFFAVTFDENYATALGLNVKLLNMFLAMICAVIIVLGMKMMGALLISNLIVLPAICAMTVLKSYKSVVIYSLILSVVTFSSGLFTSYLFSTPTGASIVLINVFIFALHFIVGKLGLIK